MNSPLRFGFWALWVALSVGGVACCGKGEDHDQTPTADASSPISRIHQRNLDPPVWARDLPDRPVSAKVKDRVWATIPRNGSEIAEVGVFEVEGISGNSATLSNKIHRKYRMVPGSLIHPLGNPNKLRVGDVGLGQRWGAGRTLGRVTELVGGEVRMKYLQGTKVVENMMAHAEPIVKGFRPLAWVSYEEESRHRFRGMIVAVVDEKVYVHTDSSHVKILDKKDVFPLEIDARDFKAGDRVLSYRFGSGFQEGTVEKVMEPRLRYRVKLQGRGGVGVYFFADLVEKATPDHAL
jgi:hypothetical protein